MSSLINDFVAGLKQAIGSAVPHDQLLAGVMRFEALLAADQAPGAVHDESGMLLDYQPGSDVFAEPEPEVIIISEEVTVAASALDESGAPIDYMTDGSASPPAAEQSEPVEPPVPSSDDTSTPPPTGDQTAVDAEAGGSPPAPEAPATQESAPPEGNVVEVSTDDDASNSGTPGADSDQTSAGDDNVTTQGAEQVPGDVAAPSGLEATPEPGAEPTTPPAAE